MKVTFTRDYRGTNTNEKYYLKGESGDVTSAQADYLLSVGAIEGKAKPSRRSKKAEK